MLILSFREPTNGLVRTRARARRVRIGSDVPLKKPAKILGLRVAVAIMRLAGYACSMHLEGGFRTHRC